ncbi:hypothetical protein D3C86_1408730 [compost metagenome]
MPDGVDIAVLHRLHTGESRALGQVFKLAMRFLQIRAITDADPVAARHITVPVAAGDDDLLRVGGDDLFRIDVAEGAGNDVLGHVDAAGKLDHLAEILVAERHAAIIGVTAGALHEHDRLLRIGLFKRIGDLGDGVGAELDEVLGDLFLAGQLAHEAHARLGIFHRLFAEIDVNQRNADLGELFDIACFFGRRLGVDIHQDHVRLQRNGLLDVEGAVLHAAESRQLGNLGIFGEIGGIGFRIGFRQIVAPANDVLERVFLVERSQEINLATFAEDDVRYGHIDLDIAARHILDGDLFGECRPCGGYEKAKGKCRRFG